VRPDDVGGVRLATLLAVIVAAAMLAAPASAAPGWRAAGNRICTGYYDDLAIFAGRQGEELTPDTLIGMARLTERKDSRLARLNPPAPRAGAFTRMVGRDRHSAHTLREVAKILATGHGRGNFDKLLSGYQHDITAVEKLARSLRLPACAGDGSVVTGSAEEL
jgi:hypothetical protein